MRVEKYYNENGEVAVLYSPGFGAAWSAWSSQCCPDIIFDKRIVELVLNNERNKITDEFMTSIGYDLYTGGASGLEVEWLAPGTQFRIDEYDGNESVTTQEHLYYTA